jgi:hypothetical protein
MTGKIKMALDVRTDRHVWSLHRAGCDTLKVIARGNEFNVTSWRTVREAVEFVNAPTRVCRCVNEGGAR